MVSIYHVGARGGFVPFDFPEIFDSCCKFIMVDAADVGEIKAVHLLNGRIASSRATQIKSAVWRDNAQARLNITACPYAASIKRLDDKYSNWYVFANGDCDYILGEAHTTVTSEEISTQTLDTMVSESDLPTPSVLCIDAQGSSLEILLGADACLSQVDAIVCEVELAPFYGGNPSFSEILNLLTSRGMIFSGFIHEPVSWASPVRHPVGFRSKTMLGSADAVFVRNPNEINKDQGFTRVLNYAWVCCALGHLDLALVALQSFDLLLKRHVPEDALQSICYDLIRASRVMPIYFPPSFSEIRVGTPSRPINEMLFGEDTPIEVCLRDYQFFTLADAVKSLRLDQVSRLANRSSTPFER